MRMKRSRGGRADEGGQAKRRRAPPPPDPARSENTPAQAASGYSLPGDVQDAISKIKGIAANARKPWTEKNKRLPAVLAVELKSLSPLFLRERAVAESPAHAQGVSDAFCVALLAFLHPWANEPGLMYHLRGKAKAQVRPHERPWLPHWCTVHLVR